MLAIKLTSYKFVPFINTYKKFSTPPIFSIGTYVTLLGKPKFITLADAIFYKKSFRSNWRRQNISFPIIPYKSTASNLPSINQFIQLKFTTLWHILFET